MQLLTKLLPLANYIDLSPWDDYFFLFSFPHFFLSCWKSVGDCLPCSQTGKSDLWATWNTSEAYIVLAPGTSVPFALASDHCSVAKVLEKPGDAAHGACHITGFRAMPLGFAGMFVLERWGNAKQSLACHSRKDPAALPFTKVTHVCLSSAVCVAVWPRVVRVGPQCVIVTLCMAVKTPCPSPGQLKGRFETASWTASGWGLLSQCWSWIGFGPLDDLLHLWPGFCACWASTVLHPEVAPSWCSAEYHVGLAPWFLVKHERQHDSWSLEGAVINTAVKNNWS